MFKDRKEAGKKLALKIKEELGEEERERAVVLGIPRGGIAIGGEIKKALGIPLRPVITKKIPAEGNEELAIGALGEGGVIVWEEEICQRLGVSQEYKQKIVKEKLRELEQKMRDFGVEEGLDLAGKTAIITDDGVATGATVKAAVGVVANFSPRQIVVAVPVIAYESLQDLKSRVDKVIYLMAPEIFFSLSQFYEDFGQVTDEEVKEILRKES